MIGLIKRKLIAGAQKAIVAGLVAAGAYAVAKFPQLGPVFSEDNITRVVDVLWLVFGLGASGVVGYALTWWKANRN
jgi:hypothetical protein